MPSQGVGVRRAGMAQVKCTALSRPPREHSTNVSYKHSFQAAHLVALKLVIMTIMMTITLPKLRFFLLPGTVLNTLDISGNLILSTL